MAITSFADRESLTTVINGVPFVIHMERHFRDFMDVYTFRYGEIMMSVKVHTTMPSRDVMLILEDTVDRLAEAYLKVRENDRVA